MFNETRRGNIMLNELIHVNMGKEYDNYKLRQYL